MAPGLWLVFQFSSTNSLIDKIIRLRTDSDISHVDAVTDYNEFLLGAQLSKLPSFGAFLDASKLVNASGVQVRPEDYETFTKIIRVAVPVTAEQNTAFWAFLQSQLGKRYDVGAIFGLAFHRNWRDPSKWFCSELQAAALETAGVLKVATELNWVDPQTLLLLICALPGAQQQIVDLNQYKNSLKEAAAQ